MGGKGEEGNEGGGEGWGEVAPPFLKFLDPPGPPWFELLMIKDGITFISTTSMNQTSPNLC